MPGELEGLVRNLRSELACRADDDGANVLPSILLYDTVEFGLAMCLEFLGGPFATFAKPLETCLHCRDEECECLASTGACLDQKVARTRCALGVMVFQELRKEREDGRLDG